MLEKWKEVIIPKVRGVDTLRERRVVGCWDGAGGGLRSASKIQHLDLYDSCIKVQTLLT